MTLAFEPLPSPPSPLRRLDPRWKLLGLVPLLAVVPFLRQIPSVVTALTVALLLAWLGRLPLKWYLGRLGWLLLLLVPFVFFLPWSLALIAAAKVATMATLALVLLTSAPLNDTLKAAHALRVPGLLIQLFALTWRYVFVVAGELGRIRLALRARGYRNRASWHSYRTIGHITGTLLVRSHDRGERVAQAMRCRGFAGQYRSLSCFRTRLVDVVFGLTLPAFAAALLSWDLVSHAH